MSLDLGLNQIVDFPTRGASILNVLFTNRPDITKHPKLLAGLGDHEAVSLKIALQPIRKKPTKRKIFLWSKADESKIKEASLTFRTNFLNLFSTQCNVNDIWDYIKKEIQIIIENNVPSKMTTSKQH